MTLRTHPYLERIARREFLQRMSAAAAAALAAKAPALLDDDQEKSERLEPTADACILLWMAGGMAAPDTFDPKHHEPFEIGLPADKILSTFPAIDTALDGVRISAGLEEIASVLDRGTLVRSHVQPDLGHILHSRHQYHWHTGYVPPQTVAAPHIGAWISRLLGPRHPAIPAFIDIGQRLEDVGEKEELKAFHTAGFLGSEYGPFLLPHPGRAIQSVQPPAGMGASRFEARYRRFRELVAKSPAGKYASDYHQESIVRSLENAHRLLLSPEREAFDLSAEPPEIQAAYDTGRFGRGCLLARRLVEAGARFIEVTTEYVPFEQWDTHEEGHSRLVRMKQEIDRPVAQLIRDLDARGLLDRTLVVLATEFSRDMLIEGVPGSEARDQSRAKADIMGEPRHYGLHRHFTGGSSIVLWGGGIKRGQLHGRTADERPCVAVEKPVSVTDLHATIYRALGISPRTSALVEQRPFYVTADGLGVPIADLFG